MSTFSKAVIVGAARSPIGSFMGSLSSVKATEIGSQVVKGLLKKINLDPNQIDELIMGCVLPAGLGQAPARQVALGAGLPEKVECLTINKVCGSGLKTVMLAAQAIQVGDAEVIVAGGIENMSQAPYLLDNARDGYRMGHGKLIDSMIKDGLWDVYNDFHMGNAAELCARECEVTRESQDELATRSYKRAQEAVKAGRFVEEIIPIAVPQRKGDPVMVDTDEEPFKVKFEKIPELRPAFDKAGTVTAANASSINDGAAAVVVMSEAKAKALGLPIMAEICSQASAAQAPEWFTTSPAKAIEKALAKNNLSIQDIDLFELNEAFAVVSVINNRLLSLDPEKVNVNGGAIALGHPIGASGARILVTLLHAMVQNNAKRGLASLCIGGGEGNALIVERP